MACHLFGTKPLPEPKLTYCQLDPYEQTSMKFKSKYKLFIQENTSEYVVCEMAAILSRGRWVKGQAITWISDDQDLLHHMPSLYRPHLGKYDVNHQMETFLCYCRFVQGIHRSPVDSHHKGTITQIFDVSLLSV